jgi:hypothetical protein
MHTIHENSVASTSLLPMAPLQELRNESAHHAQQEVVRTTDWQQNHGMSESAREYDKSMHLVGQYMTTQRDWFWYELSDWLFVVGGFLFVILSIWYWYWPPFPLDYDCRNHLEETPPLSTRLFYALNIVAPFIYVFHAIVDVVWAKQYQEKCLIRDEMLRTWDSYRSHTSKIDKRRHKVRERMESFRLSLSSASTFGSIDSVAKPWYRRCGHHDAHRRTILGAGAFGVAALLGLGSSMAFYMGIHTGDATVVDQCMTASVYLHWSSDHSFIISSIICLTGSRNKPFLNWGDTSPWNSTNFLEDLGDVLFLVGCLMDIFLGDLHMQRPYWLLISSVLWLIDACLYLRTDLLLRSDINKGVDFIYMDSVLV